MPRTPPPLALTIAFLLFAAIASPTHAQSLGNQPGAAHELNELEIQVREILTTGTLERNSVMARLVDRGNTDVVPALIQSLRFMGQDPWTINNALQVLTGEGSISNWNDWVLWQEGVGLCPDRPQLPPVPL